MLCVVGQFSVDWSAITDKMTLVGCASKEKKKPSVSTETFKALICGIVYILFQNGGQ